MECPKCKKDWPKNCEQAIAAEIYGSCAWCNRFNAKVNYSEIIRIQKERGYDPSKHKGG